jgi:Prohead core protein serine protease
VKRQRLFETIPLEILEKDEIKDPESPFLMRVKAISGRADEKNLNGRIYPEHLIKREVSRLAEMIKARPGSVLEEADHPVDGVAKVRQSAARLESIIYDPIKKAVVTESKIFKTEAGKDLAAILRAEGVIGRSSRGYGTVKQGKVGEQEGNVVEDNYVLVTHDFVVGQSTKDAVCTSVYEQALLEEELAGGTDMNVDLKNISVADIRTARPDLMATLESELTAKVEATFATKVAEAVTSGIEAKTKELKATLQADFDAKLEAAKKKNGKGNNDDPDDEANETKAIELLKAKGYTIEDKKVAAKAESTAVKALETQLTETRTMLKDSNTRLEAIEGGQKRVAVHQYILEVTKGEKAYRTALIGRLLETCSSKEDVDKNLPAEKQYIDKLLNESAGGKGLSLPTEEPGSKTDDKKIKIKTAGGVEMELTESQARQRAAAGLSN